MVRVPISCYSAKAKGKLIQILFSDSLGGEQDPIRRKAQKGKGATGGRREKESRETERVEDYYFLFLI